MTANGLRLPSFATSLSARLLVLTILFVMLAEVLIYAPSIARYRQVYLEERLAAAHLAVLALEATPNQAVSPAMEAELLSHVRAHSVALRKPGTGKLMLMTDTPTRVDATYDLRTAGPFELVRDAFVSLLGSGDRLLRIIGASPKNPQATVEVVLDERPMCVAMFAYSERILALSLVISLMTAALVYLSLHRLMVGPMQRLTESMTRFRDDPEAVANQIRPTERSDEIGVAQRELASMQIALNKALRQKTRLAALGIAVTKIHHDLKNILASAQLVSDRLAESEDPQVRRVTPTLMGAIDRAVHLCTQTLNFTREGAPSLELSRFDLRELIDDVGASLPASLQGNGRWRNALSDSVEVEADREQLFRVLSNIGQNAIEAGASQVDVEAEPNADVVRIWVNDDGPGLAPRARDGLFQPFSGTVKQGGTGLGLAIARDLMRAHGGDIRLERSTAAGTSFRLELPLHQGKH